MKVAFTFRFANTKLFRAYNGDGTGTWLERKGLKFVQAALGKLRPLQTPQASDRSHIVLVRLSPSHDSIRSFLHPVVSWQIPYRVVVVQGRYGNMMDKVKVLLRQRNKS